MKVETAGTIPSRLPFADYMRAALAVLVVLHHAAVVYGGAVPFYYMEPPSNDPLAFLVLLVFVMINQSWFMGAFFLLAGYFTPRSFDRKGAGPYLKERLLRFGIPLLLFVFVLNPLASIAFFAMPTQLTGNTVPLTWRTYPRLLGMGPMWFVVLLLLFTLGYAGWRMLGRKHPATGLARPGWGMLAAFVLGLATTSYLVRIVIPIGRSVLGFPTLSYFPQYLGFFIIGIVASRNDWLRTLPGSEGMVGLAIAGAVGVFLFPYAFSGRVFSLELTPAVTEALGNGKFRSAVYALWDSTFAVGICLGLIVLLHSRVRREGRLGRFLSQQSYGVYVLHIPILVFVALALRGMEKGALSKFALVSALVVPLCFAATCFIRKVPLVSRVL